MARRLLSGLRHQPGDRSPDRGSSPAGLGRNDGARTSVVRGVQARRRCRSCLGSTSSAGHTGRESQLLVHVPKLMLTCVDRDSTGKDRHDHPDCPEEEDLEIARRLHCDPRLLAKQWDGRRLVRAGTGPCHRESRRPAVAWAVTPRACLWQPQSSGRARAHHASSFLPADELFDDHRIRPVYRGAAPMEQRTPLRRRSARKWRIKSGPDQGRLCQSHPASVRPAEGRSAPLGWSLLHSASRDAERRF
jgi:hypothetical protein